MDLVCAPGHCLAGMCVGLSKELSMLHSVQFYSLKFLAAVWRRTAFWWDGQVL